MKRIIFPFLTFLCLMVFIPKDLPDCYLPQGSNCYIFCAHTTAEDALYSGNGYIVRCKSGNYAKTREKCQDIEGVTLYFNCAFEEVQNVIKLFNAKIIFDLSEKDAANLYCYSAKIKGGVYIEGRLINLQIFYSKGAINVGTPLLLGSY